MIAAGPGLDELVRVCGAGFADIPSAPFIDLFNDAVARLVTARFTPEQQVWLRLTQQLGDEALGAARLGDVAGAARTLSVAEGIVASAEARTLVGSLASSLLGAQRAYVLYKQGRDAEALEVLGAAFRHDLELEAHGFGVLAMHRVQLAHNLARIVLRRGDFACGLPVLLELLHYLEQPAEPPCASLPEPWRGTWRDFTRLGDSRLVAQMHRQIAGELVAAVGRLGSGAAGQALAVSCVLERFQPSRPSQARLWARFQVARLQDLTVDYAAAQAMLGAGPRPSVPLWRSVAGDLLVHFDALLEA